MGADESSASLLLCTTGRTCLPFRDCASISYSFPSKTAPAAAGNRPTTLASSSGRLCLWNPATGPLVFLVARAKDMNAKYDAKHL